MKPCPPCNGNCSQGHYCSSTYPGDRHVGIALALLGIIWGICIVLGLIN